jgi:Na+/proline symporter
LLRRACQIVLTASSALLFLAFGSSGILSAGVTALLVSAMPVVLVLLASSPRQSRRLTAALLTLWLVLAGSFCGVIWLSRAGLSATRVAGIPLSLGLLLVGFLRCDGAFGLGPGIDSRVFAEADGVEVADRQRAMPLLDRPWILTATVLSLVGVTLVGLWSARRTRSAEDFFVAGRDLGLWVTAMATMTAAFSGFVFLGGPGLTYRIGLASLFIVLPVGFTAGLLCWVVGKRLRLLAEIRETYTIPDALACRYDSRLTTALGGLVVLVGAVGYLGAQLLALAVLIEGVFGLRTTVGAWSLPLAMLFGLLVVLLYSVLGGMVAGAYTDLAQGALMLTAAVLVFGQALSVGGSFGEMYEKIASSESLAGLLDLEGGVSLLTGIGFFFVFGIGVLGQPHMLHKFFMLRDPRQLRWMPLVLGGSQAVCLLIWLGIGLAVPALVAEGRLAPLQHPDDATLTFLLQCTPELVAGLAIAGALAAIMSTADSFLNIGAAALVRDLPRLVGKPLHRELAWGRVATVLIAVGAASLALAYGDLIALLGTFAFGTLAAALAPCLAVGLNWTRVSAAAASASIATGLILNLGFEVLNRSAWLPQWPDLGLAGVALPSAVALAGSLTVLCLVSWLQGKGAEECIAEDVRLIMEF